MGREEGEKEGEERRDGREGRRGRKGKKNLAPQLFLKVGAYGWR